MSAVRQSVVRVLEAEENAGTISRHDSEIILSSFDDRQANLAATASQQAVAGGIGGGLAYIFMRRRRPLPGLAGRLFAITACASIASLVPPVVWAVQVQRCVRPTLSSPQLTPSVI